MGVSENKIKSNVICLCAQESVFDIWNPNLMHQIKEIIMCKEDGIKHQRSIRLEDNAMWAEG